MVAPTFSVTLPPESSESVVVPAGVNAAEIVILPLVALPTRSVPAVTVSSSASVRPKVPAASAPPKFTSWPAVLGCNVAIAAPALVAPVKVMLSAV